MYRYYQTGEKTAWQAIPDSPRVEQEALAAGATKLTILAVSEVVGDDTVRADLSHKGPLYFDIDNHDLGQAITAANALVSKLIERNVPADALQIYASGGKGFHVIVPPHLFSSGRALKDLPAVYLEMALSLHVPGMDFQVYCSGRGNCFRIPNIKRENGKFRVPVTVAELQGMRAEDYAAITSAPRKVVHDPAEGVTAIGLRTLMEEAKRRVKARPAPSVPIPATKLEQFKASPPECVRELMKYKIKGSVSFNQAAFQLAAFIARAGLTDQERASIVSATAQAAHSTKYDTARARTDHIEAMVGYARAKSSVAFACNAMRSVLDNKPCDGCPLNHDKADESDIGLEMGIEEKPDGYYIIGEKGDRRISTFVLDPLSTYTEIGQSGHTDRRVGTMVGVTRNGLQLGTVMFSESAWASKSGLVAELQGIGNLSFIGSDADVQRIKHIVFGVERDIGDIMQIHTAGIHFQRVGRRDIAVYTEPGFSINQMKVQGTHTLGGRVPAPPRIRQATLPALGDEQVREALYNLINVNAPESVAQLLGWFCASHLKAHFMRRYSQFPILSVWGNAGCGKTASVTLFAWLNGCDYSSEDGAVNMASITPWAMLNFCSSTTTVPRLLEEYNKSKMNLKSYNFCGEIIKAAWNGNVIARGTLSSSKSNGRGRTGAEVTEIPISGPLVVVSEQAPDMPALQQRMVQLMLTTDGRRGRSRFFEQADDRRDQLHRLAKAMAFKALATPISWVEEQMKAVKAEVPATFLERPRYSYQALLVGLEFLRGTCADLQIDIDADIAMLRAALLGGMSGRMVEIEHSKQRTEVDAVLETFGVMAALTGDGNDQWLVKGSHYLVRGDQLLVDLLIAHALYRKYKRYDHGSVVIENPSQMLALLRQEPYFVTDRAVEPALAAGRTVVELSLGRMAEKGHVISMFG